MPFLVAGSIVFTFAGLLACAGCSERKSHGPAPSLVVGPIVATVNGEPIALSEVESLVRASGLSPRSALERLVAEQLLAQHAVARGYDRLAAHERAVQQASVRALLAYEVESKVAAADLQGRVQRLDSWLAELRKKAAVRYDERAIERALAESP